MKKISILFAALLAVAQMSAQSNDTVSVIEQPNKVVITQTPSGVKVNVVDSVSNYSFLVKSDGNGVVTENQDDWELNFPYSLTFKTDRKERTKRRKDSHWTLESKGFYFGAGLHNDYELINNSFNWGFMQLIGLQYNSLHGQHLSLGIGYDSKRFSLKRPNCFFLDENTDIVGIDTYPANVEKRTSILKVKSIQFPLLFQQDFITKSDFHMVLGASLNWNVYAKCMTKFKDNKTEYVTNYRDIKYNKVTFDIIGGLCYSGVGIYCRYTPSNMFKNGYGPEIKNNWTLGVCFGF